MPEVHFIGNISAVRFCGSEISVTWAILPGNRAWLNKNGMSSGETHSVVVCPATGVGLLTHPIDLHYEVSSSEGWPVFACEVWDRSHSSEGVRGFIGCGSCWLPGSSQEKSIDVPIWKPSGDGFGLDSIYEMLLPTCPDLRAIRELSVSPFLRSKIQTESIGSVQINLSTLTAGFKERGVQFDSSTVI